MTTAAPSTRVSAAPSASRPVTAPMSPNVAVCHTFHPGNADNGYSCDAADNVTNRHPHLATLTPVQHQAIDLIIRGHSDGSVATNVGVSRRTILRWKNHHPAFIAEMNFRQQQLLTQSALLYSRSLRRSFRIVNKTLKTPDSPDAIRVALALINGTGGRKALNQQIGPTNPIAVVNAMAAEEERLLAHTNSDP